jgi:3-hydroxyisobutyrate dehydrogenase-like beta-hydroxyacid dehydrogenase/ferredoxin
MISGFAGAGRMGGAMVRRLLAAGHSVTVLDHSAAARDDLAAAGAVVTTDIAALAATEVTGVCVLTDAQVRAVCLDGGLLDMMARGSALVVHTTCSPKTIELLGRHGDKRGVTVVDAAVSGGPQDIAAGRITLYVGGTADDVQRVRPFLQAYGDPVLHVGPRGTGQLVKLLNNAVFAANIGVLAEAVGVAAELGVAEGSLLQSLRHGSGSSRALDGIAGSGTVAEFAAAIGEFIGKDLAVVREVAADLGADLGALNDAHDTLARLLANPTRTSTYTRRRSTMKVHVDPQLCQGHTLCAMTAPELFALRDEDGHAHAISPDVPTGKEGLALEAARTCPEQAIQIIPAH